VAATCPIVCLPGLARTSADFHELAVALSSGPNPRRVLALDYRGRGRSDRDTDWRNYDIPVELADVLAVLTAAGIEHAVFVGTSRGGLISMGLGSARPGLLRAVVLNDIGPVIEGKGLARIKGYVGKLPTPANLADAVAILRRIGDQQFPALTEDDWVRYALRTWKVDNGRFVPDYDPALMKGLAKLDIEQPLPVLWPHFETLLPVPVLSIRGERSDLFSAETQAEMARRHTNLQLLVVPGQGHAPLLGDAASIGAVSQFIAAAG
jgi:pimeloyl-ACP methyl ester carboxylesterase